MKVKMLRVTYQHLSINVTTAAISHKCEYSVNNNTSPIHKRMTQLIFSLQQRKVHIPAGVGHFQEVTDRALHYDMKMM